jgi:O-antigen/teichoic acid export membrane protein
MGQSLIRAKDVNAGDFCAVFSLQLSLGILIFVGFLVSAPLLGDYFDDWLYADLLRVSALTFMLRPFALIRISWLNREMEFKKRALVELATGASTGVCSVMMALAGMGVWSLILSGLAGALVSNILLAYVTPLRLRLHFDVRTVRGHSRYGLKITANDFLGYLKEQATNLILSKMAGPAFLGLFNKAESLARMPNRLITPPTGQTVFRAMSKVQDDLDQTKYLFYRTITLLTVYIAPCLIGLWYVTEPFVAVIYGQRWLPAAEPMGILILAALLRPISTPCGVVLAAQNRLTQEIIGQIAGLIVAVTACVIGLQWGLKGVAWAFFASSIFTTAYLYVLVYRTISTRVVDLLMAITPAILLNVPLIAVLAVVHSTTLELRSGLPALYLGIMAVCGLITYVLAFLFLPIPALRSEAARWRQAIKSTVDFATRGARG